MQRRYWRRVYAYDLTSRAWRLAFDGWQYAWNSFECEFGDGWCNQPQPYIYEQWWSFAADTIGSGVGSFTYLGARINWGSNPVVN